jgi:type IV pilus assembly protein PilW
MNKRNFINRGAGRSGGFSLIEILVGVAVGLLCTVVIANVLAVAESRRRGTTEGSEAQIAGSLGLYSVSREVQSAGYGFASEVRAVGCRLHAFKNGASVTDANDQNMLVERLSPVVIYPGAATESDRIRVISSSKAVSATSSAGFSLPLRVTEPYVPGGGQLVVNSSLGARNGDLVVAVELSTGGADTDCYLMQINNPPTTDGKSPPRYLLPVSTDDAGWNATGHPAEILPQRSFLSNMGQISDQVFTVDDRQRLVVSTLDTATMTRTEQVLQNNVVRLKALYGKDNTGDGAVDVYDTIQPVDAAGWRNVLTVRLAIVARSSQFERDPVTLRSPLWRVGNAVPVAGATECGGSFCLSLDLSNLPDWQHHRYVVYETVVGLRNQRWRTAPPLCGGSEC